MSTSTAVLHPELAVRTAASRVQCRCARPLLGYRVDMLHDKRVVLSSPEPLRSRDEAAGWAADHITPEHSGFHVEPVPNPEYQPECIGAIFPGDRYIGDSSGAVYCLRCGITIAATSAEGVLR